MNVGRWVGVDFRGKFFNGPVHPPPKKKKKMKNGHQNVNAQIANWGPYSIFSPDFSSGEKFKKIQFFLFLMVFYVLRKKEAVSE